MLSLRRDDVTTTRTVVRITYFNPRLREGGDGIQRHNRLEESKISIHASAKEATPHICGHSKGDYFNPRLREGGDIVADNPLLSHFDFNPRLREGGDRNIL